jgi:hypothetical protein
MNAAAVRKDDAPRVIDCGGNMVEAEDAIWIESARDPEGHGAACLLRWVGHERYAPVEDVRQTAEDLFTCAAYADLIGELMRAGIGTGTLSQLTTSMLKGRQPRYFGTPTTLFLLPAGTNTLKQGVVLLARRNLFHKGKTDGVLSPDEARAMGRDWLTTAEASEADTLFGAVLHRAGWMGEEELDALFSLLKDIRGGVAEMPPATG